jgi:ABC-2 type transport system ATP-binding protein
LLSFDAVTKHFTGVQAVDELSFTVNPGEVFALLGPNGAGKTTSVRMIMGLIEPDQGQIKLAPELLTNGRADRRRLGYLPEERGLYQEATVIDSLLYLAALRGCKAPETRPRALKWLERVELAERAEDKVSSLSKGNQQKVQFIASVLHEPRLAILDEPFSGLDPINQERMCSWIRELRDQGMTIVLSAHQLQLIEQIADRILLIHQGRQRLCGTLDEIRISTASASRLVIDFAEPVSAERLRSSSAIATVESIAACRIEIQLADGAELNDVLAELAQAGRLTGLTTVTPSLHDIFIDNFGRPEASS